MQVVTLKALTKDTSACLDRVAVGTPLLIVRYRVRMAWLLPPEVEVDADDVVSVNATRLTRATRECVFQASAGQVLEITRWHRVIARLVPYVRYTD